MVGNDPTQLAQLALKDALKAAALRPKAPKPYAAQVYQMLFFIRTVGLYM